MTQHLVQHSRQRLPNLLDRLQQPQLTAAKFVSWHHVRDLHYVHVDTRVFVKLTPNVLLISVAMHVFSYDFYEL